MTSSRLLSIVCLLSSVVCRLPSQAHVVIVSGLGGDPKYTAAFAEQSQRLAAALHERFGIPASDIVRLGEDSVSRAPGYAGRSTKANVEHVMSALAARAQPGAQVVLVLIGHGAGDGADSRLSLPGPDLTAADFAALLARFPTQRVAFVNLASASGDMLATLSAPNRVVITATRTAFERNESQFGRYFVDALAKDGADTDKDGRVSLFEAFRYATRETKRMYDDDGKIQTEHAQLDDDGDKRGSDDPTGRGGEGALARRFFLDAGALAARAASTDPRLTALYAERFTLEDQIEAVKSRKAQMTADAYDDALEQLFVALARKSREIRALEGRS